MRSQAVAVLAIGAHGRLRAPARNKPTGRSIVKDEPVVVHCYTTPVDIENGRNLAALGDFCRKLGREARQGEVGLVVGDEYFAIRDFAKEQRREDAAGHG